MKPYSSPTTVSLVALGFSLGALACSSSDSTPAKAGTAGRTGMTAGSGGSRAGSGALSGGADGGTGPLASAGVGGTETGGAAGAGGGTAGAGAGTAGAGAGTAGAGCVDTCPVPNGITWQCKKRFFYGLNQAWINFAGDFGGGNRGIAANTAAVSTAFKKYSDNGASVIRWWVWPNFTGGGVAFNGNTPTGLKSTTLADLEAALKLADENNLYLQITLFSFDSFKTSANPNLADIATNATARAALVDTVVRPFAKAAEASQYSKRLISWDVANEPEWAVTGAGVGGDQAFEPMADVKPITQPQMETLFKDIVAGLRAESKALVTIGGAAMKWKHSWMAVDQDFYTFHSYDWVNTYWPYSQSPTQYGVGDKPVVMGEFPPTGLGGTAYGTVLDSWYSNGYAGALPWQDATFIIDWTTFKAFSSKHPCETRF